MCWSLAIILLALILNQNVNAEPQETNILENIATKGLELAGSVAEMAGNVGMINDQQGFELPFVKVNSSTKVGTGAAFREEEDSSEEDRRRRKRSLINLELKHNELLNAEAELNEKQLNRDKRSPCRGGGGGGGGGTGYGAGGYGGGGYGGGGYGYGGGGGGGDGGGGGGSTGGGGLGGGLGDGGLGGGDLGGGGLGGGGLGGLDFGIDGDFLDIPELRRRANARRRKNSTRRNSNTGRRTSRRNNGRRRNSNLVKGEANSNLINTNDQTLERSKRHAQNDFMQKATEIGDKFRNVGESIKNSVLNVTHTIKDQIFGGNSNNMPPNNMNQAFKRRKRQAQFDDQGMGNIDFKQGIKEKIQNVAGKVKETVGKVTQRIKDKFGAHNSNFINTHDQALTRRKRHAQNDIMQKATEIGDKFRNVAESVKNSVMNVTHTIKDQILGGSSNNMPPNNMNQAFKRRKRQAQFDDQGMGNMDFKQGIKEKIQNVAGKVKDTVGKVKQGIKDKFGAHNLHDQALTRRKRHAQNDFMQKATQIAESVKNSVMNVTHTIKDQIFGGSSNNMPPSNMNQAFKRRKRHAQFDDQAMGNGNMDFKQGIKEKIQNVAGKVKDTVGKVTQGIKDNFGAHNSHDQALARRKRQAQNDFMQKATQIAESVKNSVMNVTHTIKDQIFGGNSNNMPPNNMNQAFKRRKRQAQFDDQGMGNMDFKQGIKEKIQNVAGKVKDTVGKVTQRIKDKFGAQNSNFMNTNDQALTRRKRQAQNDFMQKATEIGDKFRNVAESVKNSVMNVTHTIKDQILGGSSNNMPPNNMNQAFKRRKRQAQHDSNDFMQKAKEIGEKVKQTVGKVTQNMKDKFGAQNSNLIKSNDQPLMRHKRQSELDDLNHNMENLFAQHAQDLGEKLHNVAESLKHTVLNVTMTIKDQIMG
ncbi:hypothetical protein CVS40_2198 [Lucilia cuprina]|nr:hypothetical protein CVS40_2198 [Lucilia cuprina]